jgi:HEAT repeat protein
MLARRTSPDYRAWREATFGSGYAIWHDGADVALVCRLRGKARAKALAMLKIGLAEADFVAVCALAALGEKSVLPALRALLPSATAQLRVTTALAIHELAGDLSVATALIDELKAEHWGDRIDAAIALAKFGAHPDVVPALLAVVRDDPDYLPRLHAAGSLRTIAGLSQPDVDPSRTPALFRLISGADGESGEARANRRAAAERLAALFPGPTTGRKLRRRRPPGSGCGSRRSRRR